MDYEIDIEEHDVLDNPAIKKIFPDISVIKKEITQYFEEEPTLKEEPDTAGGIQPRKLSEADDLHDANKKKITSVKPHFHTTIENETPPLHSNIIILGSKPKPVTQDTNKKLILGTKLVVHNDTRNVDSKRTHEDKVKIKYMQLILQDIKSYLNQNGRYCKLCCRLFLSKNALDVHKNKVHHNRICKNKHITKKLKTIETQYKCSSCSYCFSNNGNLLRHYRTIHQKIIKFKGQGLKTRAKPQNKCSICGSSFSNNGNLFRHYRTVHQKIIKLKGQDLQTRAKPQKTNITEFKNKINQMKTISRKKQITSKETVQSCHKCNICNIKFSTYGSLKRHDGKKHTTNSDLDAVEDDLVTEENPSISRGKEKRQVTQEHFGNTSARAKRKHISIKENSAPIDKFAHKNNENKLKTHKVTTDKQRLQVLSADKSREVAFVKENAKPKYDTRAKTNTTKDSNLCLHCKKDYPDQKSLIEHMYEILEPKRNSSGLTKNASVMTNKVDDKILFKCRQCSYYLPSIKSYFAHMTRNHKTESFLEVKKEEFDAQCKYCPYMSSSVATYNKHINSYHIDLMFLRIENEIENDNKQKNAITEFNSFALESVLFECNKCNVCFLSSNIARDHNQHNMKMLNNWKCTVCDHILKEQDKEQHLIQHSFSQPIKVYTLNETAINNVLYNCTKCAIHFTEKRYQEHYANCGSDTTDSYYCSVCDILVNKIEMIYHKTQHEHLRNMSDFIIVESNIIVDTASSLKRKYTHIESEVRPRKRLYEQHNCLTYCYTCKSFLSDSGLKNKSHIKRTCSHLPTYACTVCGLVFTSSTLKIHKERHETEKNFRLQDYKFFSLQGIQVIPPIPEYPHCKICKIHFLRKNAVSRHICDETDFLTCDICNIKLSEKTYKLHMSFHFYVLRKTSSQKDNSSAQQTPEILKDSTKRKASEISTEFELKTQMLKISTKPEELNHKLETESPESKLVDILPNVSDNDKNNEIVDQEENSIDLVEDHNAEQVPNEDSLVVLYSCKTCGVTVESYDEVIKHCQAHYRTRANQVTSMKKCKLCSLKFDSRSYLNHESNVHSSISKIQVLKFDPSYFTSKNMVWIKHIFQTLPEDIVKELLKNSIYQHEHRIQLECIQRGSSSIYVYKCDSCGNFIDSCCVYKHAENPCGKVRKHPCSLCGLPYISILSRTSHEKLHKQIKGLTKKSLNIILFNQSEDKSFNDRIFRTVNEYLFYQCRNCDRVVEKTMITDHVCDNTLVKCITCGLLLSKEDFQAHLNKHNDLGNFCSENFKVILFGPKNIKNKDASKKLTSCFSGTVYDYTLYKCQICKMCLKNNENSDKHTCIPNFDLDRSMCSECDLYFPSGNLRHHMKQHRIDPDFIKENINVITFNDDLSKTTKSFSLHKTTNNKITQIKGILNVDDVKGKSVNRSNEIEQQNIDNDTKVDESKNDILNIEAVTRTNSDEYKEKYDENVVDNDKAKSIDDYNESVVHDGKTLDEDKRKSNDKDKDGTDKSINVMDDNVNEELGTLYKCKCGLHFLNKQKVTEHVNTCQPKVKQYKQNCSKCHLLFNPSELFSHLVIHHGDKTQVHNYKVIEICIDGQEAILSTFKTTQSLNASKQ